MNPNFTIWFSNYDSKRCTLFRAALTLKNEPWTYSQVIANARWWVVDTTTELDMDTLLSAYQSQPKPPVVIVLNELGTNNYYDSWASLRMPMNFITFFTWMDKVLQRGVSQITRDDEEHLDIMRSFHADQRTSHQTNHKKTDDNQANTSQQSQAAERQTPEAQLANTSQPAPFNQSHQSNPTNQSHQAETLLNVPALTDEVIQTQTHEGIDELWWRVPFRLTAWPNVAQYGTDVNLVLFCSKMLRGYMTFDDVALAGFDTNVLNHLLHGSHIRGEVLYDMSASEPLIQVPDDIPPSTDADNPVVSTQDELPVIDTATNQHQYIDNEHELIDGEENQRGFGLFDSIVRLFKRV